MSDKQSAKAEINAKFDPLERAIHRGTMWLPIVSTAVWGATLGMVIWSGFNGEGLAVISNVFILVFAIMMVWFYWDVDARRHVAAMKYDTAANLLDHLVQEHGWTWDEEDNPSSLVLHAPESADDEDETEK